MPENNTQTLRHGFLIHDVSRLRRTVFDQRMKHGGITRSQYWVLINLSRHEEDALTQVELARLLDVGKVTVGGLIDRLEENGFIKRAPDPKDRRSKLVSVSNKGRKLVIGMQSIAFDINSASLEGVTDEEYNALVSALEKMKGNLRKMDASRTKT